MLNKKTFKSEIVIESPGRINLIGEHIDYNGGHVLPAAIDKKISLRFRMNNSNFCEIRSSNFKSSVTVNLDKIDRSEIEWHNFILGVLFHINAIKPNAVKGFDCIIESNLPFGAGISSSAALECGLAKGINELFDIGLTDLEIIKLSRDAEHAFVGTKCGIMDQFAVVKGQKDHLILLNCDTLDYQLIEADFDPYVVLLLNTNVSHNLANSAYNDRRDECDKALATIQKKHPEYRFLTEVPSKVVKELKKELPQNLFNRALFVCEENQRTLNAVDFLKNKAFDRFGQCLYQSHYGLQHLYDVSCKELDFLVEQTTDLDYVLGARMMGGGFGGCTVNIVHKDKVEELIDNVKAAYEDKFNITLTSIITTISDGTKKII